ncbi:MAG: hypothetical protein ACJ8J0_16975, partial [Longimicrobiaceae bacterium]
MAGDHLMYSAHPAGLRATPLGFGAKATGVCCGIDDLGPAADDPLALPLGDQVRAGRDHIIAIGKIKGNGHSPSPGS